MQAKVKLNEQQLASLSSSKAVNEYLEHQKDNIRNLIKQNLAVGDIYRRENLQVCMYDWDIYPLQMFSGHSDYKHYLLVKTKVSISMFGQPNLLWLWDNICFVMKLFSMFGESFGLLEYFCIYMFCSFLPKTLSKRLRIPLLNSNVKTKNMMKIGLRIRFECYLCLLTVIVLPSFVITCMHIQDHKYLELPSKWSIRTSLI